MIPQHDRFKWMHQIARVLKSSCPWNERHRILLNCSQLGNKLLVFVVFYSTGEENRCIDKCLTPVGWNSTDLRYKIAALGFDVRCLGEVLPRFLAGASLEPFCEFRTNASGSRNAGVAS